MAGNPPPNGEPYFVLASYNASSLAPNAFPFSALGPAINAAVAISEDLQYFEVVVVDSYNGLEYLKIAGRGTSKRH